MYVEFFLMFRELVCIHETVFRYFGVRLIKHVQDIYCADPMQETQTEGGRIKVNHI